MRRLLTWAGLVMILVQSACAWRPSGWVFLDWPWVLEQATGEWYWFKPDDTQWVYGNPPADGWSLMAQSGLASGWAFCDWPYFYEPEDGAWFWINEADEQWVVNMRGAVWSRFGQASSPADMALVPGGTNAGTDPDNGPYSLVLEPFFIDRHEVSKALWDEIRDWGRANGYTFANAGAGKSPNHPVQMVSWWDCIVWCNARSEREERQPAYYTDAALTAVCRARPAQSVLHVKTAATGYRLPTGSQWEYAARGGAVGHRFPWSQTDLIQHARANYFSDSGYYSYDTSESQGFHPFYAMGDLPYTSPGGSFAANGYGLYDLAGNVREWCQDGLLNGSREERMVRGGSWFLGADRCRVAFVDSFGPDSTDDDLGFRTVVTTGQTGLTWLPDGWVFMEWPWAYEAVLGDWHWFNTADTQWVFGYPPAAGWSLMASSGLAAGWAFYRWPYAFSQNQNAWYWFNVTDVQWAVNMRTGAWQRFGQLAEVTVETPVLDPDGGVFNTGTVNVTATCATPGATIRYTTNGSDPTTSSPAVASGAQVTVPVPGTLKVRAFKDGMNPSAIRSASYARMTCVATYDPGAGTVDPGSMTVIVGEPYGSLPFAQRTGYTFGGWRLGPGAGGTPVTAGTIVTTYTNHTLGAAWTANKYTVSFNGNGSTGGSTPSTTNTYDAAQALPANGFIRAGFAFAGWATSAAGPAVYADGQVVVNLASTQGAVVWLYAAWTAFDTVAAPVFNPDGGPFPGSSVQVTVTCATPGATIYFTTNGIDPTTSSPTVVSDAQVTVPVPGTLKARAYKDGMNTSAVKRADYTAANTVATPEFIPAGGTFSNASGQVTITCTTTDATIHFTTNGVEPTAASPSVASGAQVTVPVPGTLKARAYKDGMYPSAIRSASYTRLTCTVAFDPAPGTVTPANQAVTVNNAYGSLPVPVWTNQPFAGWWTGTGGTGTQVTEATVVTTVSNHTLHAYWTVATPAFNPDGGTHAGDSVQVTVTCATPGATIRYTTDGGDPTTASPVVPSNGLVTVSVPGTLKARAFKAGLNPSAIRSASYNRQTCVVTFDPSPGTVEPASKTVTVGEPYGSLPTPLRTGYTAAGWWTGAGGSGTQVTPDTTVTATTNHTLHAKWTANTYQVAYDANGGSGVMLNSTYTYDADKPLTKNVFYKTGFTFAGWATSPDGPVVYDDEQVVRNLTSDPDGVVLLFAVWI